MVEGEKTPTQSVPVDTDILQLESPTSVECYICDNETQIGELLKMGTYFRALPVFAEERQYAWNPAPDGWFCPECYESLTKDPLDQEPTETTSQEYDSWIFCQECGEQIEDPEENPKYCSDCRPDEESTDSQNNAESSSAPEPSVTEPLIAILNRLNLQRGQSGLPSDVPRMRTTGGGQAGENDSYTLRFHDSGTVVDTEYGMGAAFDATLLDSTFTPVDETGTPITSGQRVRFQSNSTRLLSELADLDSLDGITVTVTVAGLGLDAAYQIERTG